MKFNILIVGAIFFCGILMGGMFLYATSHFLEAKLDQSGKEIAAYLGANLADDILLEDRFAILEWLMHAMEQNEEVRYIIVTSPDHQLLVHTFPKTLPKGLPAFREADKEGTISLRSSEGRIREILYPVDNGIIGHVRVGMTERKMAEEMQRRFLEIFFTVSLVCLIAAYFATRYARLFLEPIACLSKGVQELEKGNFNVAVPVDSWDEMGNLVRAFNRMAHSLSEKNEENRALMVALQEKEAVRVRLIKKLFSAREDERRRISQELHDESGQSMASILAYLRILHGKLMTDEQRDLLMDIRNLTADTMEQLRCLAVNLHPPMLEDFGLARSVEKYLETFRRGQKDLCVSFESSGDFTDIDRTRTVAAYRTLQEALTNIVRHAQAQHVHILLWRREKRLCLSVEDDGVGFDESVEREARLNQHLGLVSMKERVDLFNGTCEIHSKPGVGTKIFIML